MTKAWFAGIATTRSEGPMDNASDLVTCDWLTPTRIMPNPYCFEAGLKPWSCLRDGYPRPLDVGELRQCAACPRWEPRTFDAVKRDLVFEVWGTGDQVPSKPRSFDEVKRDLVLEAWGVESR
jgi:hypothetical protein